jgi:hypothetical protein
MAVTAKISGTCTIDETLNIFGTTSSQPLEGSTQVTENFVSGTSATPNGVNQYFSKAGTLSVTLAAAGTVTYTLTALTDALGRATTFAGGVRGFWVKVTARTAGDFLTIGAAATNPWTSLFGGTTPTLKVYKYFCIEADLTDKYVVAAGSNEQLKFTNSGSNSMTFEFGLIGCSS